MWSTLLCLCQFPGMASECRHKGKQGTCNCKQVKAKNELFRGDGIGISPDLCCHPSHPYFYTDSLSQTQNLLLPHRVLCFLTESNCGLELSSWLTPLPKGRSLLLCVWRIFEGRERQYSLASAFLSGQFHSLTAPVSTNSCEGAGDCVNRRNQDYWVLLQEKERKGSMIWHS